MRNEEFSAIVNKRIAYCMNIIAVKRAEYSPGTEVKDERLQNFKDVAAMNRTTLSTALWGMVSKQIVSVKDMMIGTESFTEAYIAEKFGDVIIYTLLAEACMIEEGRVVAGPLQRERQIELMNMIGIDTIDYSNWLAATKAKGITGAPDYTAITDVLTEYYGDRRVEDIVKVPGVHKGEKK